MVAVAGNDQNPRHAGLAGGAGKEVVERLLAGEVAHGEMRHRLEARPPQPRRGGDRLVRRPPRHRAEVDVRARGRDARELRHLGVDGPVAPSGKPRPETALNAATPRPAGSRRARNTHMPVSSSIGSRRSVSPSPWQSVCGTAR
jgi:hypothetical protein